MRDPEGLSSLGFPEQNVSLLRQFSFCISSEVPFERQVLGLRAEGEKHFARGDEASVITRNTR